MALSRKQYTLAAAALGSSLAFIDASAVIVALPTIQKNLHIGLSGEQWVFLSYSIALAGLYLIGGALGDRYGRRKMFARGVLGFAAASAIAGLATSGSTLIIARVLQGVAGAFVTTNSLAWLRNVYAGQAGRAVGLWTSLTGISTVIAPPLGGALTQWLSWRWIFYINIPLACLVIYWAARSEEDKLPKAKPPPLDLGGALLIALGLSSLSYYLVDGAKHGFSGVWWALLAGLGSILAFIVLEKRTDHPMLPLHLFKVRNFSMSNLETFLIYGALGGVLVYFTLYLQFLGLSPLGSSLFLIPTSIVLILLASYFGGLSDRIGPRKLLTAGPALIAVGVLMFSMISSREQIWLRGGIGILFFSLGLSMLVAPITAVALTSAPSKYSGIASGLNNTVARAGGLVMIALLGAVISGVFFEHVNNRGLVPLGLHQTGFALLDASQKAFQTAMWLIAALAALAGLVGWFGISNKKPAEEKAA